MAVNSSELLNNFGNPDLFDIESHKKRLMEQYFPNVGENSSLGKKIETALLESRTDTERLRLEMIISNGQRQYKIGFAALEDRMRSNIGNIINGNT